MCSMLAAGRVAWTRSTMSFSRSMEGSGVISFAVPPRFSRQAGAPPPPPGAGRPHDPLHPAHRRLEVVVHHEVIVRKELPRLVRRGPEARSHLLGAVPSSPDQPLFERPPVGRKDGDQHSSGEFLFHLAPPLDVDLQDGVLSAGNDGTNRLPGRVV